MVKSVNREGVSCLLGCMFPSWENDTATEGHKRRGSTKYK
jgi:hypothetical protein